jgi:hypothetical protein
MRPEAATIMKNERDPTRPSYQVVRRASLHGPLTLVQNGEMHVDQSPAMETFNDVFFPDQT